MIETKDFISLLVTIELGILAAALTLLAIYPAIVLSIDASLKAMDAAKAVSHEHRRRQLFRWLSFAAIASFVALLALMVDIVGFVVEAKESEFFTICCQPNRTSLREMEVWFLRFAAASALISLFSIGKAGFLIFRLTREET